jgi:predicted MPP superfamily phosphohydrolase
VNRRQFLRTAALGTVALGTGVGLAQAAPRRLRLTHHRLRWGSRARIVHLTDLHVGWATPPHLLRQAIRQATRLEPDLVVLTGDYLNHTLKHLAVLERFLALLPRPCVATMGNHDHWAGAAEIQRVMERLGIVVLSNRSTRMQLSRRGTRLTLVGVDDGRTDHDDVARAFAGVEQPERALVLTHFPPSAEAIARHGGRLILTGHTHGGQLDVPLVTRALSRLAGQRYIAGWYPVERARLYVNAGIGSSAIRCRVGRRARPEVALLELA